MNQANLNRAVARATGEPVDRIHRMGFSLVVVSSPVPRPIGNYAIRRMSPLRMPSRSSHPSRKPAA